jgi:hypothetical protein
MLCVRRCLRLRRSRLQDVEDRAEHHHERDDAGDELTELEYAVAAAIVRRVVRLSRSSSESRMTASSRTLRTRLVA